MIYSEASWCGPDMFGNTNRRPAHFQHIADRDEVRRLERANKLPRVRMPVRCDDATRFPNIAAAVAELDTMPADRRAELEKDWK